MRCSLFVIIAFFMLPLFASAVRQADPIPDTLQNLKGNMVNELFIIGKSTIKGYPGNDHKYIPFKGHWSGFSYGFINFANTDYSMYGPQTGNFMDLDWGRSFVLQFNIAKYSINLAPRNNYGIVCGLGLEYQRMRFSRNDISITNTDHKIEPLFLHDETDPVNAKRSTFKTLYLTIPVLMEIQFPVSQQNRMYVSGGFMGGVRMHSKTKIIYKDANGKEHKSKEKGDFNMVPFKVDAVAKVGYRYVNLWGSYTLTRMFESGKGPKLHPYTIGLGIAF